MLAKNIPGGICLATCLSLECISAGLKNVYSCHFERLFS